MAENIENRKSEHVEISLRENVNSHYNYWEDVDLIHYSIPDIDLDKIDTTVSIFGKKLNYPIIIEGMTGGFANAKKINENLGKAAEKLNIGMGVGSERAIFKHPENADSYAVLKDLGIPLKISNLGVPQLISQKNIKPFNDLDIKKVMELINADVIAFHLNYLQELVQPEGEHRSRGVLNRLSDIAQSYPVLAKETGAGVSKEMALALKRAGVIGIDVGGAGGTSFSAVEYYRAKSRADKKKEILGELFWDWGIPAPASIYSIRNIGLPIIGSGGIKSGLDIAKAIVLGAEAGGMARELLPYAAKSTESVMGRLEEIIYELKATMFLVNAKNVRELQNKRFIVHNKTKDWIENI